MGNEHLHSGLEKRLSTLEKRILKLKLDAHADQGIESILAKGEIERLERRHKELAE